VLIAACAALALSGGGVFSVDQCIKTWRQRRAGQIQTSAQVPAAV